MFGLKSNQIPGHLVLFAVFLASTVVVCADCCTSRIVFFTDMIANAIKNRSGIATNRSHHQHYTEMLPPPPVEPEKPPDKFEQQRVMSEHDQILLASVLSDCFEEQDEKFCLNGGRCFNYTPDHYNYLPTCECYGGFWGERCEMKYSSESGIYKFHPKKISFAKVYIGSFLAGIIGTLIIYFICVAGLHYRF